MTNIYSDFIDTEFQDWLLWYWNHLPDRVDTGQKHRAFLHHRLPWTQQLYTKLRELINPYEQNFDISTAYLSDDYLPGGVHSDGWIQGFPETISRTYLIPLEYHGTQHTVVFRETHEEAITFNAHTGMDNAGIVHYRQANPRDYLADNEMYITDEFYQQYLSHLNRDGLRGLHVDSVLPWQPLGAVSWPRRNFHCGGYFPPNQRRFGLIIMTCATN